jgi:hypothetical protein
VPGGNGDGAADGTGDGTGGGSLESLIVKALNQTAKDDGWSSLGETGSYLLKSQPSFDPRSYGFGKLSDLISSLGYVEVKWSGDAPGRGQLWARPKQGSRAAKKAASAGRKSSTKAAEGTRKPAKKSARKATAKAAAETAE